MLENFPKLFESSSATKELQSWTKMLRKMHVVCLILEYFPLKPGSLKILPPPPPHKNNVEVWPEHFCCLLNNIDQGGVGGGVHHSAKFAGWVSCV